MTRLRIFSCHHLVPVSELSTPIFQTLVSGVALPAGASSQTDLDGRNIAGWEKFCELRHQYYVWQNLMQDVDYVGFEHYRRQLYLDPTRIGVGEDFPLVAGVRREIAADPGLRKVEVGPIGLQQFHAMRRALSVEQRSDLISYVADHDVIATNPIFESVQANFVRDHAAASQLWDEFMWKLKACWRTMYGTSYIDDVPQWSAYLNMFVMRADWFCEYMELLFTVLSDMDAHHPEAPARIWGHMSERVLGAFLTQKLMEFPMSRFGCVPYVLFKAG